MRGIAEQLGDFTRAAAEGRGALLMDAQRLSRGHDVCTQDPWLKGMHPPGGALGAPLHPPIDAMTAIAQGLDPLLDDRPAASD